MKFIRYNEILFDIFYYYWGKELYKGLPLYSLSRKIYFLVLRLQGRSSG